MGAHVTGYPDHFIVNGDTTSCPCAEHSSNPAREELERQALNVGSPEYDVWFGLLLDRYRAEVLHQAADLLDVMELEGAAQVRYLATPYTDDPEAEPDPRNLVFNCQTIGGLGE
ncbi:hypothetical protein ACFRCI_23495 [Streptomyces sp. NPDC056638]|uniref:hypothetical protein n=1 Tax=Streptomyces sp. NPDC056638 TaxID=3345887 RepID=UPI00367BE882